MQVRDTIISYMLNILEYIALSDSSQSYKDIKLTHHNMFRFNNRSGVVDSGMRDIQPTLYLIDKAQASQLITEPTDIPDALWVDGLEIKTEFDDGTRRGFSFTITSLGLAWGTLGCAQSTLASKIHKKLVDENEPKYFNLNRTTGPFYVEMWNLFGNVVNDQLHARIGAALTCGELQCQWDVPPDQDRRHSTIRPYRVTVGNLRLKFISGEYLDLLSHNPPIYLGLPDNSRKALDRMDNTMVDLLAKDMIFPTELDQMIFLDHLERFAHD